MTRKTLQDGQKSMILSLTQLVNIVKINVKIS